MTNLDKIRNINIGGVYPFRNADRTFMGSMLAELSFCEECPWLPDMYDCEAALCQYQVNVWLDAETADCSECEASGYCAELDTEYPNCEDIRKEYGKK